jgi:hypothetical protein
MFNVANVFRILQSLLRLFTRRRPEGITPSETAGKSETASQHEAAGQSETASQSETAAVAIVSSAPQGNGTMRVGFDIHSEIRKLAGRILEPVASKLNSDVLGAVADQIRNAFEQLLTQRTTPDTDFETMAVNIVKSIQPMLTEKEFVRIVDRLRGAMLGFCQGDWSKTQPRTEQAEAVQLGA